MSCKLALLLAMRSRESLGRGQAAQWVVRIRCVLAASSASYVCGTMEVQSCWVASAARPPWFLLATHVRVHTVSITTVRAAITFSCP